jgi:pSer/pThr/pTyr-binding forkhead associated (FHA) protein
MKLVLVVTRRTAPSTEIPVQRFPFLIGRDPRCHLRPATPLVSARHCSIDCRDERVLIRDLNSTNGTSLNGLLIQAETELHDGDKLRVGPIKLQVQLDTRTALTARSAVAAKSDSEDDDTIASLLLSMSEDTKTDMGPAEEAKPLLEDTAVMPALAADTTVMQPAAPTPAPPPSPEKSTSAAADRILKSYLKRPRKS